MKKQQSTTSQEEQQERQEQEFQAMLSRVYNRVTTKMELIKLENYKYNIPDETFDKMNKWDRLNAAEWEALLYDTIGDMPSAITEVNGLYVFHTAQKDGTFRLIPAKGKKNKQIWVETSELMQKFEKIENKGYKLIYEKEQTRTIWLQPIDGETIAVSLKLVSGHRILYIAFYVKNIIANLLRNEDLAEKLLSLKWDDDLYKSSCSATDKDKARGYVDVIFANEFAKVINKYLPAVSDFWALSKSKKEKFILQKKENGLEFHRANGNSLYYDDLMEGFRIEKDCLDFSELENEEDIAVALNNYVKELSLANKV